MTMHINKPWRHDQVLGIDCCITHQRLLGDMTNGTTANTHISNRIEISLWVYYTAIGNYYIIVSCNSLNRYQQQSGLLNSALQYF